MLVVASLFLLQHQWVSGLLDPSVVTNSSKPPRVQGPVVGVVGRALSPTYQQFCSREETQKGRAWGESELSRGGGAQRLPWG